MIFDKSSKGFERFNRLESMTSDLFDRMLNLEHKIAKADNNLTNSTPITDRFADSITGLIGLKEMVTASNKILKFIWTTLFILGVGGTIYFIYATTKEFLDEPSLTKVRLQGRPFYDFPSITLCNEAWFDTEKATKLGLSIEAFKYSLGYWNYENQIKLNINYDEAKDEFIRIYRTHNFSSLHDYYQAISMDIVSFDTKDAFLTSTSSSHLAINGQLPSEKIFLPLASICRTFRLKSIDTNFDVLSEPESIYLKFIDKTNDLIPAVSTNWQMRLYPNIMGLLAWPLIIRSSTKSIVTIKQQQFISLNSFDNPCLNRVPNENFLGAACMSNCFNRFRAAHFGCSQFFMSSTENSSQNPNDYCNYFDRKLNETNLQIDWRIKSEQVVVICKKRCPRRCDRTLYEAIFEGQLPIRKDFRNDRIDYSNASITAVYFKHDAIYQGGILITKEVRSYSFIEFVNNVGGTLGLFIGGTLMTLAQLILFMINYYCEKKKTTS